MELVKTYMKKELIMNQSKQLGIHYDILSKESVEFLFKIRSSLMHEAAAEGEFDGKPVPQQLRDIFSRNLIKKNIALKAG